MPRGLNYHFRALYYEVRRDLYALRALNRNYFAFQTQVESTTSPLSELRQRLGLPAVAIAPAPELGSDDEELLALGKELLTEKDQNSPATGTSLLKVRLKILMLSL